MAVAATPSPLTYITSSSASTGFGLAVFKIVRRIIDLKYPGFLDVDTMEGLEELCVIGLPFVGLPLARLFAKFADPTPVASIIALALSGGLLSGCTTELQAAVSAANSATLAADDTIRNDEAVGLGELTCRLPYRVVLQKAAANPMWNIAFQAMCGPLPNIPITITSPGNLAAKP